MIGLRGRTRPLPLRSTAFLAAALLAATLRVAPAMADDGPAAIVQQAQWLEQRGQNEQAQELVRRAAQTQPGNELLALARAQAYLADKNPFWALKVLGEFIAQQPPACAARALAARIHVQEANLEQAEHVLDEPECERPEESKLRRLLLRTEIAELRGDRTEARRQVLLAEATNRRYAEDDRRLMRLSATYDPHHRPALGFKLDLGVGWASQAMASVPLDLATKSRHSGSALLGMDLQARWIPISWPAWRPVAEVELHLAQYLETPAKDLSSRQPILRLGLELGRGPRRLVVAYAADWVNLEGGNEYPYSSFAYSQAHRLEFRIELDPSMLAYGAFGRRRFWQAERSRVESEQGLSKTFVVSDTVRLTTAGAWRFYSADRSAYDQVGATLHTGLDVSLPKGFELREALALSAEFFPRSEGYFDPSHWQKRRDALVHVTVGLSAPETLGVRLGLLYGYTNRNSLANAYDFTDHRAILALTWQSDSDQLRVRRIPKTGRVSMPYPDDESQAGPKTKAAVIEVIEHDQAERRSTSCMK
jgi:hypothetical protein